MIVTIENFRYHRHTICILQNQDHEAALLLPAAGGTPALPRYSLALKSSMEAYAHDRR